MNMAKCTAVTTACVLIVFGVLEQQQKIGTLKWQEMLMPAYYYLQHV